MAILVGISNDCDPDILPIKDDMPDGFMSFVGGVQGDYGLIDIQLVIDGEARRFLIPQKSALKLKAAVDEAVGDMEGTLDMARVPALAEREVE